MEKTKETLYEDTWYQETKSICDRFYNPSNLLEIFGVFLAFAQVCTSQHGFSGDHNRD